MRGAVFGEPLRAHPAKIGLIDAPGNTCVVEQQRATGCDENCDHGEHGLDAAGTRRRWPRSSPTGPPSSVRLCTPAPVSRHPTAAVRLRRALHSSDDRLNMPVKRLPVPTMPPAFDVPAFLESARMSPRAGHSAIRNSGFCCRWLDSPHVFRTYQDTAVHCRLDCGRFASRRQW